MMKSYLLAAIPSFLISAWAPLLLSQPARASSKFYCGNSSGVPATMTTTRSGKQVPIILWKSGAFSSDGWSPERRCEEVSQRFNNLHQTGALKYLTTGRTNGMPVICAAKSEGSGCVEGGLLYTLKPGQNAGQTLRNLLAVRTKATGPLTETTSRPYFSMASIEETAEANASDGVSTSNATSINPVSNKSKPSERVPSGTPRAHSAYSQGNARQEDSLW